MEEVEKYVIKRYIKENASLKKIESELESLYGIKLSKQEIFNLYINKVPIQEEKFTPNGNYRKKASISIIIRWLKRGYYKEDILREASKVGVIITSEDFEKAIDNYAQEISAEYPDIPIEEIKNKLRQKHNIQENDKLTRKKQSFDAERIPKGNDKSAREQRKTKRVTAKSVLKLLKIGYSKEQIMQTAREANIIISEEIWNEALTLYNQSKEYNNNTPKQENGGRENEL